MAQNGNGYTLSRARSEITALQTKMNTLEQSDLRQTDDIKSVLEMQNKAIGALGMIKIFGTIGGLLVIALQILSMFK
jgi:hypothetical protein